MTDLKWIAESQRRRAYEDTRAGEKAAAAVIGALLGGSATGFIWIFWNAGVTCIGA